MGNGDWMPQGFIDLNTVLKLDRSASSSRHYDLRSASNSEYYVYGLGKAAAKYKLAQSIENVVFSSYVKSTQEQYIAQIRLMAAFIAFEAYSKLRRNRKWYELAEECSGDYANEASDIRTKITSSALMQLEGFMDSQALKNRLGKFRDGDNSEVFAVACAMRNGFAHGLYGSRGEFKRALILLRPLLLQCIEDDCQNEVRTLTE